VARFDGVRISFEGGLPLLAVLEPRRQNFAFFASCFEDQREPDGVEHRLALLVAQRLAVVLGYEDLLDHDELRSDRLLAAVVGQADVLGKRQSPLAPLGLHATRPISTTRRTGLCRSM
jgi:hypothetical protein